MTRIDDHLSAVAQSDRPEIWIERRTETSIRTEFEALATRGGPLAGLTVAVKNNVDVAGLVTTAACPDFSSVPAPTDAVAVARLRAAGATVVGATNLDQFATGLVGQRSPYGGVRDARRPEFVSGGSSSGSAVAVALGLVDLAIGTDTAGSGRVPAAFQGIVGIKATLGVVSTDGVVPACRSYDCVTLFARTLDTAAAGMGAMAGGPGTRPWPSDTPLAAPSAPVVAVPAELTGMAPGWAEAFDTARALLEKRGCVIKEIEFDGFLEAARLLYDGALVAERHAAVGAFVDAHPHACDPTVGAIISRAGTVLASDYVRDTERLERLARLNLALIADCDALMVPTAPGHPTRQQVADDPIGVNSWVGTYTNFCNLFDLCAVAVPCGTVDEPDGSVAQFGVTVLAPAFHDAVALDIARLVESPADSVACSGVVEVAELGDPWPVAAGAPRCELFVVGAHLPGQPLVHQLESRGARWVGAATTAEAYSLHALDTAPPKPGLTRVGAGGAAIVGGVWHLSPAALGTFLAELPAPMQLGSVELSDGRWITGFAVSADAVLAGAQDITAHGGWLNYLAR